MKLRTIIGTLLLLALLTTATSAQTENKDLPTEQEITNYLSSFPSSNFVESASEASMNDNPTWKWDTWTDAEGNDYISFYYTSNSAKGYGSLYYDDLGNEIGNTCGLTLTLEDSYKGEEVQEEKPAPVEEVDEPEEDTEEICEDCVEDELPEEKTESKIEKGLDIHYSASKIKTMTTQEKLDVVMKVYYILMGD